MVDRLDITVENFNIPKGFKPRKRQVTPLALLDVGMIAPDWTLYDANG